MGRLLVLLLTFLSVLALTHAESYWTREMNRVLLNVADDYMRYVGTWGNVTMLPSGIGASILRRGHGSTAPASDDDCLIHYTGLYRFPRVFTDTRNYPFPVHRKPSQMVPGVQEALKYMREGDRWFIYVPYKLAYGREGNAELRIEKYMNLRYDIELVSCSSTNGLSSSEIDAYLKAHFTTPIPPKSEKVDWDKM